MDSLTALERILTTVFPFPGDIRDTAFDRNEALVRVNPRMWPRTFRVGFDASPFDTRETSTADVTATEYQLTFAPILRTPTGSAFRLAFVDTCR